MLLLSYLWFIIKYGRREGKTGIMNLEWLAPLKIIRFKLVDVELYYRDRSVIRTPK